MVTDSIPGVKIIKQSIFPIILHPSQYKSIQFILVRVYNFNNKVHVLNAQNLYWKHNRRRIIDE